MSRNEVKVQAVLIAGPTASGKSRLALALARETGGTIVNADSMQVYDGLRLLTARPSDADLAAAPHRLYGHVPPTAPYSVGLWSREVAPVLAELRAAGKLAIVCGGTGLYFKALLGNLDAMPEIPPDIRDGLRARMVAEGPEKLYEELQKSDSESAARIRPQDPQRITRALEIIAATGRPIGTFRGGGNAPLLDPTRAMKVVLTPSREALRERIARRFSAMLTGGAIDEVRRMSEIPGVFEATAGKAIGLSELAAALAGHMTLETATQRAVARTRQYAKRQDTFFRHQFDADWTRLSAPCEVDVAHLIDRIKEREG
ncbi:MAG: tRNA (adenosine(37)-N6)-dimethylallyltransferase MiaA [Rhizobiaceae bacterium]|nr:tRNA (adenosine(37)-N6)-dimethylallyltransferase MiaA [Rhizobiaceae bacterium]